MNATIGRAVRRIARLAACALVATPFACGATPLPATQRAPTPPAVVASTAATASASPTPAAPTGDGTTVGLLDAGSAPRRVVRYAFRVGYSEVVTIDLQSSYRVGSDADAEPSVALPVLRLSVVIEPKTVTTDGGLHYDYRLVSTELLTTPSTKPEVIAAQQAILAQLKGLAGSGLISASGLNTSTKFTRPKGASASCDEIITEVQETIDELAIAFPEEAIGVGASWAKMTFRGSTTTHTTFTLVETAASSGKVSVLVSQDSSGYSNVKQANGESIRISDFGGSGSGSATYNLARLAPTSAIDAVTTMTLSSENNGAKVTKPMTMKTMIRISGGTR